MSKIVSAFSQRFGVLLGSLCLGLMGCKAIAVPAIQDVQVHDLTDTPANEADPFGGCVFDSELAVFPFTCSQPGAGCTGWGRGDIGHIVCEHDCETDTDCPMPLTGDVTPVCLGQIHACELPCDETSKCPDGHICTATSDWQLTDAISGKPDPLPFICMQTVSISESMRAGMVR